jgi:hypothetical protein
MMITFEEYRHLFRDDQAMAEFAGMIESTAKKDEMQLLFFQKRLIATALSPEAFHSGSLSRVVK